MESRTMNITSKWPREATHSRSSNVLFIARNDSSNCSFMATIEFLGATTLLPLPFANSGTELLVDTSFAFGSANKRETSTSN